MRDAAMYRGKPRGECEPLWERLAEAVGGVSDRELRARAEGRPLESFAERRARWERQLADQRERSRRRRAEGRGR